MSKLTIGVFFGSRSAEHDVSIITAISSVIKPLKLSGRYNILPIYITKQGDWFCDERLGDVGIYSSGNIEAFVTKTKPAAVLINNGLTIVKLGVKNKYLKIDAAFPATHGTYGEDGSLMGLFEMANIPYVGCNLASSVLAMDKVLSKQIAQSCGIKTPAYCAFDAQTELPKIINEVEHKLTYPLFVKPPHLGSSIAISRVTNTTELKHAIELALHYDNKVLIEQAVTNLIEVTVPIMGNHELKFANTEEPASSSEFFDFKTKYMQGGKKGGKTPGNAQGYSHIPARIDPELERGCLEVAGRVYKALGCSGMARIDLLIDKLTKEIYFNEVNPLPGSLYAHNWRTVGVSGVDLVCQLVDLAVENHKNQAQLSTAFSSNFLKQF